MGQPFRPSNGNQRLLSGLLYMLYPEREVLSAARRPEVAGPAER